MTVWTKTRLVVVTFVGHILSLAIALPQDASSRGGSASRIQRVLFTVDPHEGPASGGTQVTMSISSEMPKGAAKFHCAFGEKVVPAQSYFASPEAISEPSVLCVTPAGQARSSVTVRLTVDGSKYWPGPRFFYHDPVSTVTSGPRTLLGDGEAMDPKGNSIGNIGTLLPNLDDQVSSESGSDAEYMRIKSL
eukprot:CAMPEP_0114234486 /NCGR_PEP_ID=MMETSP0058-20121206/5735_1 /TAXON_ID=36894 /ORGANISM="Pyramimonas parkeae, CCMP726" /LENGTH=190 /DNA_ID=CAMNT_0001346169 /DNA_START=178 /DNA_END=750 /DNA_ORIENTATION=+